MTETLLKPPTYIVEPAYCKQRLAEFAEKANNLFVIEDVMAYLGINPESDGAVYAIPGITAALRQLGCKPEKLVCFIPPSMDGQKIGKDVEQQIIQHITNLIRDVVLSKKTEFKLCDLYHDPQISTTLPCDLETIRLVRTALIGINCTMRQDYISGLGMMEYFTAPDAGRLTPV